MDICGLYHLRLTTLDKGDMGDWTASISVADAEFKGKKNRATEKSAEEQRTMQRLSVVCYFFNLCGSDTKQFFIPMLFYAFLCVHGNSKENKQF